MQRSYATLLLIFAIGSSASFSQTPPVTSTQKNQTSEISAILGLGPRMDRLRVLQAERRCGEAANPEELTLRQDISEVVQSAAFDVEGVQAEIENERALLMEIRASLGNKRDRAVNITNVANLVTGTGIGIAVNALQFSSSTANVGNSLGVGSGVGTTILSILGIRLQRGSKISVGRVPNMLAPLFDRQAVLNTEYPETVRAFLRGDPAGSDVGGQSRLERLKADWKSAGRLPEEKDPAYASQVTKMTSSEDPQVKITIDDLSNRIAMLGDVSGRAGLMKRDLARLLRTMSSENCTAR